MKRAGDVFSLLFNDEKQLKNADTYSALISCWKDLVEKNGISAAAAHSWIKSLDKGLVWIEVDHPGWKQILRTKESKLLSDFHRRFPEMDISGISIMLCRPGAETNSTEQITDDAEKSGDIHPAAGQDPGYEGIKDQALKDVLMRLERSIMERQDPRRPR